MALADLGNAQSSSCEKCGGTSQTSFVYVIGRVEPKFPSLAVEKEFAQAIGRTVTDALSNREMLHAALTAKENRYLLRHMCWVLRVERIETYLLAPRLPEDIDLFVDAIRPRPSHDDIDVVIGIRGPIAPATACNGLMLPILIVDQLYSFNAKFLIDSIPVPDGVEPDRFREVSGDIFTRVMSLTDNSGNMDEHRALNYIAVRYAQFYETAYKLIRDGSILSNIDMNISPLSSGRKIIEVVLKFVHKNTSFEQKRSVRVDVTDEFPFILTHFNEYYRS
jgi:hypothetical protein